MATLRYSAALSTLQTMDTTRGCMTGLEELWKWELQAHHFVGDYAGGLEHWRRPRAAQPGDYRLCVLGIPGLLAPRRETAVDSLISSCANLTGVGFPAKIPNRDYFDLALPHYLAHGNIAAARRAADRMRPALAKYAQAEKPKALDLALIDCMFGDWAGCYPKVVAATDSDLIDLRRLGVVAAHAGDTARVRSVLRFFEAHAATMHRGYPKLFHAMIAIAGGKHDNALWLLGQAMSEGVSPSGSEWFARQKLGDKPHTVDFDLYHAWEFLPLRGDPVFEAMFRGRK